MFADDRALLLTADILTPVHDDPVIWGKIAAANSLSDVYAMGGRPLLALNLVAFPRDKLPLEVLQQILAGGAEKAGEAGVCIAGGHSLDAPEPAYGLAVVGEVAPDKIIRNSGARPGDALVLTKPLGVGIIVTAGIADIADPSVIERAAGIMQTLNAAAAEVMADFDVHAATDITGFGLVGHAHEMAAASGVAIRLRIDAIPFIPEALEYAKQWALPEGLLRNREYYKQWAPLDDLPFDVGCLLCDPQTSGGLLISLPPDQAEEYMAQLLVRGQLAWVVGEVVDGPAGMLTFV